MHDPTPFMIRQALINVVLLEARQLRRDGKGLDELEDWLLDHQLTLADGKVPPKKRVRNRGKHAHIDDVMLPDTMGLSMAGVGRVTMADPEEKDAP